MPKIPIDEAPAGPAMDAAVAKALSYEVEWSPQPDGSSAPIYLVGTIVDLGVELPHWIIVPNYSIDIAAAWELEESLGVDQQSDYIMALFNLVTTDLGAPGFLAFKKAVYWRMVHAGPLNKCRAFLKASGVEYVEVPE